MADYKSAHLAWIHSTPKFLPKYAQDYRADISYFEIIKHVYNNPNCSQEYAKLMFVSDKVWYQQSYKVSNEIDKAVKKLEPTANGWWFVTIGFNHQTWSIKKCCQVITKIIAFDWIISVKANFELYRPNGEHPHCHFVIETDLPKSKILEKIWRPKYVQEVVLSKSFIDIKKFEEHHRKYINLEKTYDKMECVNKDIIWRGQNNIPDFEKNWIKIV